MWAKYEAWLESLPHRRLIFVYDLICIGILGVIGWLLLEANNCTLPKPAKPSDLLNGVTSACALWVKYKILFNCMWFGALGGLTISLKGVYDHGSSADPWKNDYNLWHLGRPVSCAIAGLIAGLLLVLIVPRDSLSPIVLYGIAFIFGTQDKAFFDFLSQFAGRFLSKSDTPPTLQVTGVLPAQGAAGTTVRITGQSIDQHAVARIGGIPLGALKIAPDGTAATGIVPTLTVATNTQVDLDVVSPGGRSIVLIGGFKYL